MDVNCAAKHFSFELLRMWINLDVLWTLIIIGILIFSVIFVLLKLLSLIITGYSVLFNFNCYC